MGFELHEVVPWGRNLDEYCRMFALDEASLSKKIVSFGDGPASFNSEMSYLNKSVVSLDPIYQFTKEQIRQRIDETKKIVLEQAMLNHEKFNWNIIKSLHELEEIRMRAMNIFLDDFEIGKHEDRYVNHAMPTKTLFRDNLFDIALSSHFLMLYTKLGLSFHLESITEMLRVAKEVRIFPLVDLNGETSPFLEKIIMNFKKDYCVEIIRVDYHFQKNANEMLHITKKRD